MVREGRFSGWEPELLLGRDVSGAVLGLAGFGRIARATVTVRREMSQLSALNAVAIGEGRMPPHPVDPEASG